MAQDDVLLHGFGFTGYRSFSGPEIERVGPMSKVHLVAGPNNVGKSNILAVAQRVLPRAATGGVPDFVEGDTPVGVDPRETPFRLAIASRLTEDARTRIRGAMPKDPGLVDTLVDLLDHLSDSAGLLWLEYESTLDGAGGFATFGPSEDQATALVDVLRTDPTADVPIFADMARALEGSFYTHNSVGNARTVLQRVHNSMLIPEKVPDVATVSAFRRIGPGSADPLQDGHDGPGLIERLQEIQSPSTFDASEAERRYAAINRFVATLFDDTGAFIRAANNQSTIFLHQNGRRLPLENVGTGVHEVIIMAAAATVLSGHLVCIEEPEIHLHPTLQRKLLTYLHEETDNQYLIATHSAHLLDTGRASISAISMEDGRSRVSSVIAPRDVAALSNELGVRASDLVQANAIVWVEGPSDRTYLRRWLALLDDGLVEGQHFSIMFYGGALLSELSPEDPSVDEFVSLPRINQNFSIVIDSDRQTEDAGLNATKTRVSEEFAREGVRGTVWVTAGYTIENYVPRELLADAVAVVHPQGEYTWSGERYTNPLGADRFATRGSAADKTAIARTVVERWTEDTEWPLDLRERIAELAAVLREVNDLPPRVA